MFPPPFPFPTHSEYDVDELLGMVAVTGICEDYIPEGQACTLPLGPGSQQELSSKSFLCLASIKVAVRIISRSVWKRRATSDPIRGCPRYPHSLPQGGIDRRHNIIVIHIVLKYRHGNNDAGQGVIRAEATFLTPSGDNFGCVWIRVAVDH